MSDEHSPLPWTFDEVSTSCGRAFRIGSGEMLSAGKGCCIIYDDYGAGENQRKANAALIVQSVNALPGLVKALEELEQIGEKVGGHNATAARMGNIAHAALIAYRSKP